VCREGERVIQSPTCKKQKSLYYQNPLVIFSRGFDFLRTGASSMSLRRVEGSRDRRSASPAGTGVLPSKYPHVTLASRETSNARSLQGTEKYTKNSIQNYPESPLKQCPAASSGDFSYGAGAVSSEGADSSSTVIPACSSLNLVHRRCWLNLLVFIFLPIDFAGGQHVHGSIDF